MKRRSLLNGENNDIETLIAIRGNMEETFANFARKNV